MREVTMRVSVMRMLAVTMRIPVLMWVMVTVVIGTMEAVLVGRIHLVAVGMTVAVGITVLVTVPTREAVWMRVIVLITLLLLSYKLIHGPPQLRLVEHRFFVTTTFGLGIRQRMPPLRKATILDLTW